MADNTPSSSRPRVTFVTGNAGKLREVQAIIQDIDIVAEKVDLPELQGPSLEVAKTKAATAYRELGGDKGPCLVEDTSLCFDALNGLPGPYIKWFLEGIGHEGLNKMLDGFETRDAHALCIFTLATGPDAEKDTESFIGECFGTIVRPTGGSGFGWDPIFRPNVGGLKGAAPGEKTFAEMTPEEKNEISHRRRALDNLATAFVSSQSKREREGQN